MFASCCANAGAVIAANNRQDKNFFIWCLSIIRPQDKNNLYAGVYLEIKVFLVKSGNKKSGP